MEYISIASPLLATGGLGARDRVDSEIPRHIYSLSPQMLGERTSGDCGRFFGGTCWLARDS
jgi:hypothetical protein